jgi:hypothetical protein
LVLLHRTQTQLVMAHALWVPGVSQVLQMHHVMDSVMLVSIALSLRLARLRFSVVQEITAHKGRVV